MIAFTLLSALLSLAAAGPARAADERLDILLVGDSHTVGPFGQGLDERLRTLSNTSVRTYASCGSAVNSWYTGWRTTCGYLEKTLVNGKLHVVSLKRYPTPHLANLLTKWPTEEGSAQRIVVVALGSNSVGEDDADKGIETMATDARRASSKCFWIGPPRMRKFGDKRVDEFYTLLARGLKTPSGEICTLIDSRKYTHYPPKTAGDHSDGVHYYFPGASKVVEKWDDGGFSEISAAFK